MAQSEVIKIDLDKVLRERLPGLSGFIPRPLVSWLKRTICQEQLNRLLEENAGLEGAEFCRGVFRSLDLRVEARGEELLPPPANRHVLYVSNHPLGGLDGMALIDYVQRRHGGRVYFVVNDLLMAVRPLEKVFLPINKSGRQNREAIEAIDGAFAGDDPIIMFPAGLVSRLQKDPFTGQNRRIVADLPWKKMFVNKAFQSRRDVIPLFFSGRNSMHFYRRANLRKRLGLKFNFEQIYLPGEIFGQRGNTLTITFGEPVSWRTLTPGKDAEKCAQALRKYVYNLDIENQ